jgi:hypothetical protein
MISRMKSGPPSGSKGQSDPNTTCSAPKKSRPQAIHGAEEALAEAGAHPRLVNSPDPAEPPRSLRRVKFDGIVAKAAMQGKIVQEFPATLRSTLRSRAAAVHQLGRCSWNVPRELHAVMKYPHHLQRRFVPQAKHEKVSRCCDSGGCRVAAPS